MFYKIKFTFVVIVMSLGFFPEWTPLEHFAFRQDNGSGEFPQPILTEHKDWIDLYNAAWQFARSHINAGTDENGFADLYMDEGFNPLIFQWDTAFMTLFGKYALNFFPVMPSLDNFYNKQRDDGFISRVYWEEDGTYPHEPDSLEPMINPPLYAWAEWQYYLITNDTSRFSKTLPVLDKYFRWIKANCLRKGAELYYITGFGSGMDNSPRKNESYVWVDISAQQALSALYIAKMAGVVGNTILENQYFKEYQNLKELINYKLWDDDDGIYYDLKQDGSYNKIKTIASFWPMLAEIPEKKQVEKLVAHLENPDEFWRPHVFPTVSADMKGSDEEGLYYDPKGYYWRGGVWAPTNYMVIKGLEKYGYFDLAARASENHINNMFYIYKNFIPPEGEVDDFGGGDGINTIWEAYSPEYKKPSTTGIKGSPYLSKQNFVGWSGLGPISLLIENLLGFRVDAPNNKLKWRLRLLEKHGIENLRFGINTVTLVTEHRSSVNDTIKVNVKSNGEFILEIENGLTEYTTAVKPGNNYFTFTQ